MLTVTGLQVIKPLQGNCLLDKASRASLRQAASVPTDLNTCGSTA
jgi:hypothetical protein